MIVGINFMNLNLNFMTIINFITIEINLKQDRLQIFYYFQSIYFHLKKSKFFYFCSNFIIHFINYCLIFIKNYSFFTIIVNLHFIVDFQKIKKLIFSNPHYFKQNVAMIIELFYLSLLNLKKTLNFQFMQNFDFIKLYLYLYFVNNNIKIIHHQHHLIF